MKELSIEEKAKRYDEAIEIAREINNEQRAQPFNVMTRVFPELKESEGEKTRKEILDYIIKGSESCYDVQQYGKEKFKKWISWLEKKGEKKQEWSEEDVANIMVIIEALQYCAKDNAYKKEIDWLKSLRPQSQWKPSKEQMSFLKGYAEEDMVLQSLYNDLKKLTE